MKQYVGTKIIGAEPMDRETFEREFNKPVLDAENEQGYHVQYPDGYHSWSPKKVFEESYREITAGEWQILGKIAADINGNQAG